MNAETRNALASLLGSQPSGSPTPATGGCIHDCYQWGSYFIKTNSARHEATFRAESNCLRALAATDTIRVPEVVAQGVSDDFAFLVLEHLELLPSGNETLLGEQLASLHHHQADRYGFTEDNFIGATPQPNPWTNNWAEFFRDHRIGHLLKLLGNTGIHFTHSEKLLDRTIELVPANPVGSLLHGDLWAGNKAFLANGSPVVFDPACYHGHAACDLAMTTLFGGFSNKFYDAYRNSSEMDDPSLRELYNLYHVLNHALLFGGSYVAQADGIIRRLA